MSVPTCLLYLCICLRMKEARNVPLRVMPVYLCVSMFMCYSRSCLTLSACFQSLPEKLGVISVSLIFL